MALTITPEEIIAKGQYPLLVKHDSWKRIFIDDVAIVQNGFAFKSDHFTQNEGFPLIRIRDINNEKTENFYSGEFDEAFLVKHGDLLVGMDGDFNCALWKGKIGLLNQRVCRIKVDEKKYSKQFFYYVLQPYLDAINAETSAITVKHLSSATIKQILLPFPPLSEQHRIVEKIETLFSELDSAVTNLKTAKAQLKRYRQSVLKSAFEGKLTARWREAHADKIESAEVLMERIRAEREAAYADKSKKQKEILPLTADEISELPELPEGWIWIKSGELFEFVTSGSRGWARYYSNDGALFIRITNLDFNSLKLDLRENKIQYVKPPKNSEGSRTRIQKDDFLFSITGYLGMFAIAPALEEAYVNQHIALARPLKGFHYHYFGHYVTSSFGGLKYLQELQKGAVKAGLRLNDIYDFSFPICGYEEQHQIVSEIESRLSEADAMERTIDDSLAKAEKMRQSILKKAFEGKLIQSKETHG